MSYFHSSCSTSKSHAAEIKNVIFKIIIIPISVLQLKFKSNWGLPIKILLICVICGKMPRMDVIFPFIMFNFQVPFSRNKKCYLQNHHYSNNLIAVEIQKQLEVADKNPFNLCNLLKNAKNGCHISIHHVQLPSPIQQK